MERKLSKRDSRDSELAPDGTLQNVQYEMRDRMFNMRQQRIRQSSIPPSSNWGHSKMSTGLYSRASNIGLSKVSVGGHSKVYTGNPIEEEDSDGPSDDLSAYNAYYRTESSSFLYKVRRRVIFEIFNGSRKNNYWTSADVLKAVRAYSIRPGRTHDHVVRGKLKRTADGQPPMGTLVTGSLTFRDLRQLFVPDAQQQVPTIEIRRGCIVLCLPPVTAIILVNRVYVLNHEDLDIDPLLQALTTLSSKNGAQGPAKALGGEGDSGSFAIPVAADSPAHARRHTTATDTQMATDGAGGAPLGEAPQKSSYWDTDHEEDFEPNGDNISESPAIPEFWYGNCVPFTGTASPPVNEPPPAARILPHGFRIFKKKSSKRPMTTGSTTGTRPLMDSLRFVRPPWAASSTGSMPVVSGNGAGTATSAAAGAGGVPNATTGQRCRTHSLAPPHLQQQCAIGGAGTYTGTGTYTGRYSDWSRHKSRPNSSDGHDGRRLGGLKRKHDMSFEFAALEILTTAAYDSLETEITLLEAELREFSIEKVQRHSTYDLELLHHLKGPIEVWKQKLLQVEHAFDELLTDAEDMKRMELWRYYRNPGLYQISRRLEPPNPDLQLLLEHFGQEADLYSSRLAQLSAGVDNLQQLLSLRLAVGRNKLIRLELGATLVSVGIAVGSTMSGIFGMNLYSGLEETPHAFIIVGVCIVCLILCTAMLVAIFISQTPL